MSKPFCVLLSQLASQKYQWAGKPFRLLMCDGVLFVSCRIIFVFCFCWSLVPSSLPAGALCYVLMVGDLPHSLFLQKLHFSHHFPRFSCCFLSSLCNNLLISPFALFHCSLLVWGFFPLCFVSSPLALPYSPYSFVIVCQMQDIQWGWPTCVFAAAV